MDGLLDSGEEEWTKHTEQNESCREAYGTRQTELANRLKGGQDIHQEGAEVGKRRKCERPQGT